MPRKAEKKTRVTISVTSEEKRRLEEIAIRSEISLSRVAQEAVKQFISNQPGKVGLFGPRAK
jgi:predicted transcriptional regulator